MRVEQREGDQGGGALVMTGESSRFRRPMIIGRAVLGPRYLGLGLSTYTVIRYDTTGVCALKSLATAEN